MVRLTLDTDELSVLRGFDNPYGAWRIVSIFRSGGGRWRRESRQRLKRKGLLEAHPTQRRVWRITEAGRKALQEAASDD